MRSLLVAGPLCLSLNASAAPQPNNEVALLDEILASVAPGQNLARVDDMWIAVDRLQTWRNQLSGKPGQNFAFDGVAAPWTSGNVYYTFDVSVSAAKQKTFLDAAGEWAMFANLHFIARAAQANYITVRENNSISGGQSAVGMVGGQQFLDISQGAWTRSVLCHEIGHALGMIHEHQRSDRDSFVTIVTNNILAGSAPNFVKLPNSLNTGTYDFLSVMHYSKDAYSVSPGVANTIVPLPAYTQFLDLIGRQYDQVLSPLDRAGMAVKYGAGPTLTSVVTNTLDSGAGSLRGAMYYALDHPGTTITFNIPTSDPGFAGGVFTIKPTDNFPSLMRATILDASTQPNNSNPNGPEIVLNGSSCDPTNVYSDGLRMTGTNCVAQSLIIIGFPGTGIVIDGTNATGNAVRGCYVNVNTNATAAATNRYDGVLISHGASFNTIGGTNAAARNIISGSAYGGVVIRDAGTRSNTVSGNYIGVDRTGTAALPNKTAGILIYGGAQANLIGGTNTGAGNVISGNGFEGVGLADANTIGNIVAGNFIGLNAAGTAAISNTWQGVSIFNGAKSNLIGGTVAAARNFISGNGLQGLAIIDPGTVGNVVAGNYIGLNAAGSAAVANGWSGIQFYNGSQFNTIGGTTAGGRNVISGNSFQGIYLVGAGTSFNLIAGNYIGLNPAGSAAIPNGWTGMDLGGGAATNTIGGNAVGAGNVISGNGNYGIVVGSDGNTVSGNIVGLDATESNALPNAWTGVLIGDAKGNLIGSTSANAGNVIAGNLDYGLELRGANSSGNVVQGNSIGLNSAGAQPFGNGWGGVILYQGAHDNVVGYTVNGVGAANKIAFNFSSGIMLLDDGTTNNSLRANLVFSNSFVDINLYGGFDIGWGVTLNDEDDSDSGPNQLQNYPVLTQATGSGANTLIGGTFQGAANRTLIIDLFRNDALDITGYGEGQRYIGNTTITTDVSGAGSFSLNASGNFSGQYVSATATDFLTGNTSEFSQALLATNGPVPPVFTGSPTMTTTGFVARVSLKVGQTYRVQGTTNLAAPASWIDLTNFTASVTNWIFLDRSATGFARRFYRVATP